MNKRGLAITTIVIIIAVVVVLGGVAINNLGLSPKTSLSKETTSCEDALDKIRAGATPTSRDIDTLGKCNDRDLTDYAQAQGQGSSCDADLDGDGVVGVADLLILLGNWGTFGPGDLDGDGVVGVSDLLILLGSWGPVEGNAGIGDLNDDCKINFLDLSIMQDEWGHISVAGLQSDLNNDGIVDGADLDILIDSWDEVEGNGTCDELSIPNTIGGCTQILCFSEGGSQEAQGGPDNIQTFINIGSEGNNFIEVRGSGKYVTKFNSYTNELIIKDGKLKTKKTVDLDNLIQQENKIIDMTRVSVEESKTESSDISFVNLGHGGEHPSVINITYDKQTNLTEGDVGAYLFCYDFDPVEGPSNQRLIDQEVLHWGQETGEVHTETLFISEDYSGYDKCHIRLHDELVDFDENIVTNIHLMADVSDEVYFTDVGLIRDEIVDSLVGEVPEYEGVSEIIFFNYFLATGATNFCGDFNNVNFYHNGHPDIYDSVAYTVQSEIREIKPMYVNKNYYLAQGWKGYPLIDREIIEKYFTLYNPSRTDGIPRDSMLPIFAKHLNHIVEGFSIYFSGPEFYLPLPLRRKLTITSFNGLNYSDEGIGSPWDPTPPSYGAYSIVRIIYSNAYNQMSGQLYGSQFISEFVNELDYFDDLDRVPIIIEGSRGFIGLFEDKEYGVGCSYHSSTSYTS